MWDPGFSYVRCAPALLRGYHRAFCVNSVRFRGTPEKPGLVLGLDQGGSCRGRAFLVVEHDVQNAIANLWAREMSRFAYRPRLVPIEVEGAKATALAFLANRAHESYAGRLEVDNAARTIAACSGAGGPNVDYLVNTLRHLDELGITEGRLHQLLEAVQSLHRT
jgi:cation transport protein ChaC